MERRMSDAVQPLAFVALVLGTVAAAAVLKFADLPTRVSVVESRQASIEQRLTSMDNKLDALLARVR